MNEYNSFIIIAVLDLFGVSLGTQKFITVPGSISTIWGLILTSFISQRNNGLYTAKMFTISLSHTHTKEWRNPKK